MQTGASAQSLLRSTLRNAASISNPQRAIIDTLSSLVNAVGAVGASLTQLRNGQHHFSSGDASSWTKDADALISWATALPSELTQNTKIDGFSVTAAAWHTLKPTEDQIICIWYDTAIDTVDEEVIAVHADVLCLLMAQHHMNVNQERANLLANSILGSIADPLVVLDDNRAVMLMNEAAEQLFGTTTASAFNASIVEVINDDDLIAFIQAPDTSRQFEWTTGENSEFTFLPLISAIQTPDGLPDGWVLTFRDVSRFKRLNRNQQEFLRVVSHDLRSPLTSIQGFADMVRMGMVGDVTEKQVYFMNKILGGIDQMAGIVENIQDAGRFDPETGFYEMQRAQIDVHEIAKKIVQNQIVPAEKQEITVELNVADNLPIIYADENMMTRGITNLVDNAIKYTPNGGMVEVGIQRENNELVISVKDDGYGISEEDQKKLFQRHSRIHRKEHAKVKGTGLGLFIVRSVAQRHGGDARVHSILGEGATFSIVIPLEGENIGSES